MWSVVCSGVGIGIDTRLVGDRRRSDARFRTHDTGNVNIDAGEKELALGRLAM